VVALEYGLRRIHKIPICLRLIRELHARLLHGVRGREQAPGEFRRVQNLIGPEGVGIADATFVPPPVHEMHKALDAFERFLHRPSRLPPLVRLAAIHYQFEAIHPFRDGNGRVGRLLISLLLCSEGVLPQPLLYLSAFFERNRREYYRRLLSVSQRGDWAGWVGFFLRGVVEESIGTVERATRLRSIQEEYHRVCHAVRSPALLLRLVDQLFVQPAITLRQTAEALGVTRRTAQRDIDRLVAEGILVESTGQKRNRVYVAREIIAAMETTPAPPERPT
jgi:Fic family protein